MIVEGHDVAIEISQLECKMLQHGCSSVNGKRDIALESVDDDITLRSVANIDLANNIRIAPQMHRRRFTQISRAQVQTFMSLQVNMLKLKRHVCLDGST